MKAPAALPTVHIFLPVHNRQAVTERFIECLRRQTYQNWHLLLIDDGSSDGTSEMARALVPKLTVLQGKGDWWWGGGLQQGYQWISRANVPAGDIVLMINDDTDIAPDFLSNAVAAMRPNSLLCAQAYRSNGDFCEAGVSWDWKNLVCKGVKEPDQINCFSTRGLFVYVADLLKIGGFYPTLLPHYLSDYEFTIRARRRGFTLMSNPDVRLRYFEDLTGIRSTDGLSVWKALKTNLSIKSTANPIYWTSFILLACPARYQMVNLGRIWWRYLDPLRMKVRPFMNPVISPLRRNAGRIKRRLKRKRRNLNLPTNK